MNTPKEAVAESASDSESDSQSDGSTVQPEPVTASHFWLPDLSLVGVAVIWGVNIPLMKNGLEAVDPYTFNAIRLLISAIVLSAFAIRERRAGILPKPGVTWKHYLTYAAIVTVSYQVSFLLGINLTTPGNVALIIATVPMWTALLARIFMGERLALLAWAGLLVALIGTAIVALQGNVTADSRYLIGNAVILGSALLWSCGTVYSRPLLRMISPLQLAAVAGVIAWPVHLGVAWLLSEGTVADFGTGSIWLILIYSGVLSSGLSQPMWHFGVKHAGAAHAAIVQNLIPVVAIVATWISRGEAPTGPQMFGGAMILIGLVSMRISRAATAGK